MSALIDAEIDGQHLSEEELLGFCFTLIVAGNDTTTNLIANGAVLLAEHPDQRARLVREPAAIANAIEEMLRCESPAQALPRRLLRDATVHGRTIPKGAMVRLVWAAANRDEREFANADTFDITRPSPRHLGFGVGAHFCLGSQFARREIRTILGKLAPQLAHIEPAGEAEWAAAHFVSGVKHLPVAYSFR